MLLANRLAFGPSALVLLLGPRGLGGAEPAAGGAPWCQLSTIQLEPNHQQPVMAKKNQQLTVRVSSEEKREIERRAAEADLSVSRYLAKSALSDEALMTAGDRHEMVEALRELYREIRSIGGNINQLAYHLNRGGKANEEAINRASKTAEQAGDAIIGKIEEVT